VNLNLFHNGDEDGDDGEPQGEGGSAKVPGQNPSGQHRKR